MCIYNFETDVVAREMHRLVRISRDEATKERWHRNGLYCLDNSMMEYPKSD